MRIFFLKLLHQPHHLISVQTGDLPDLRIRQTGLVVLGPLPEHAQAQRLRRLPIDTSVRAISDCERLGEHRPTLMGRLIEQVEKQSKRSAPPLPDGIALPL